MHTPTGCIARAGPSHPWLSTSRRIPHRHLHTCSRGLPRAAAGRERGTCNTSDRRQGLQSQRCFASNSTPTENRPGHSWSLPKLGDDIATKHSRDVEEAATGHPPHSSDTRPKSGDKKYYGSYRRRASRSSAEERVVIPDWFLYRNVQLREDHSAVASRLEVVSKRDAHGKDTSLPESTSLSVDAANDGAVYQIDKAIFDEISFMMLGGLRASSTSSTEDSLNSRSHLLLQSPQAGAESFLDAVVAHAAHTRRLDLLTIEPQDIADLAAASPEAFAELSLTQVRRLGFDTYLYDDDQFSESPDESIAEDGTEEGLDATADDRSKAGSISIPGIGPTSIKPIQHMIQVWFPRKHGAKPTSQEIPGVPPSGPFPDFFSASNKAGEVLVPSESSSLSLFRRLLSSPSLKRERQRSSLFTDRDVYDKSEQPEPDDSDQRSQGLIVHIKDYLELSGTAIGGAVLDKLHSVVDAKRRDGKHILICGTSSSSDLVPSISESGISAMQSGSDTDKFRTIVTTCRTPNVESIFVEDSKIRTAQINCRNILATIRELFPDPAEMDATMLKSNFGLSTEQLFQFDLAEEVWPLERVQRLVSIASGMLESDNYISGNTLFQGLSAMEGSDKAKFAWATEELKKNEEPDLVHKQAAEKQAEKRRATIKNCNRYEKKLLGGVIDAQKVKTTFDDVHVPPSTIEALKTLTTLSLVRPDAFTYGVLATDKIPGLLLYGPPGTGKTMLAKAVAKESGATVLDVAGSDIYDMYVGEGEKNIRAIFTLARKLSPCVVFIDEADAIFGSRSGSHNRKSHRELINQFLREWDGMNDFSAFIMVATNRPFDLDDAVLRRLPRRLLVDLPTQVDREAILRIHLKDEQLADDVSIPDLSVQTPYYSGSDLKNLCVAAALACVREENEAASLHRGNEPYNHPQRRTLRAEHFDRAVSEISASVSEDMSSLAAIRKFDERYGDKGRKKRSGGLGFGTSTIQDQEREKREEGRVRKADLVA